MDPNPNKYFQFSHISHDRLLLVDSDSGGAGRFRSFSSSFSFAFLLST